MLAQRCTLEELEQAAASGDPHAAFRLARYVTHGLRGAARSDSRALELLETAATAGHAAAACTLGDKYMRGSGVDKNEQKMIEWWRRAAELGSVDAQANLYGMLKGDEHKAERRRWLVAAAEGGSPYALDQLQMIVKGKNKLHKQADLAEFARTPLTELAARAVEDQDEHPDRLEVDYECDATEQQIQTLFGDWVDRLAAEIPDAYAVAGAPKDGVDVPIDFPGLDPLPPHVTQNNRNIEMRLAGTGVEAWISVRDGTWHLNLFSGGPHPDADRRQLMLESLTAAAASAGVELREA